ncbi:hypothetical protein D3C87_1741120 [compost metagenome]
MNAKLLQKIEELTLYIIEQKKDIDILKKEKDINMVNSCSLQELKTEINKLKNK